MLSILERILHCYQYDFNEKKYWKRRLSLQWGGVLSKYYLLYCRRVESKKCADTGTGLPFFCTRIESPIRLPHGLGGIIFARNVIIGRNVTVFQHVTIAEADRNKKTVIEDDVMIGAGAVILNNAHIGKGAKIGANAVVVEDVPPGCTVAGVPAKIIKTNN